MHAPARTPLPSPVVPGGFPAARPCPAGARGPREVTAGLSARTGDARGGCRSCCHRGSSATSVRGTTGPLSCGRCVPAVAGTVPNAGWSPPARRPLLVGAQRLSQGRRRVQVTRRGRAGHGRCCASRGGPAAFLGGDSLGSGCVPWRGSCRGARRAAGRAGPRCAPPPGHWGGGKWQQGSEEHGSLAGGAGLGCLQGWEGRAGAGEGQESALPGCLQLHHDTLGLT